jgi:hypothetical protein
MILTKGLLTSGVSPHVRTLVYAERDCWYQSMLEYLINHFYEEYIMNSVSCYFR